MSAVDKPNGEVD